MAELAAVFARIDLPKTAILLGLLGAIGIILWEVWRGFRSRK